MKLQGNELGCTTYWLFFAEHSLLNAYMILKSINCLAKNIKEVQNRTTITTHTSITFSKASLCIKDECNCNLRFASYVTARNQVSLKQRWSLATSNQFTNVSIKHWNKVDVLKVVSMLTNVSATAIEPLQLAKVRCEQHSYKESKFYITWKK